MKQESGIKGFLFYVLSIILYSLFIIHPVYAAVEDTFGKIQTPIVFRNFIQTDASGASAISMVLNNLIALIYSIAIIVLIFMILWGAFDWLTSGGDKERLQNAQRKLINAFVGIILFAIAFAVIRILGQFTGFKFFVGQ